MIEFNSATHEYKINGRPVPSVTQILQALDISKSFEACSGYVLDRVQKKADIGTRVHSELEYMFCIEDRTPLQDRMHDVLGDLVESDLDSCKRFTEHRVGTDRYAGTADLIIVDDDARCLYCIDYKTGSWEASSVSWQTSLYLDAYVKSHMKFANPPYERICYCIEIEEEEFPGRVTRLSVHDSNECDALIDRYYNLDDDVKETEELRRKVLPIVHLEQDIRALKNELARLEAEKEKALAEVQGEFDSKGYRTLKGNGYRITYSPSTETYKFNEEQFRQEYVGLWDKYKTKPVTRKASFRITLDNGE